MPTKQLRAAPDENEKRKVALTAQQATLEARAPLSEADAERIEEEVMRHAANARALLKQQVAHARQMIRRLLEARFAVTPLHEGKGVTFTGTGNYGGLLSGKTLIAVASGSWLVSVRVWEITSRGARSEIGRPPPDGFSARL